MPNKGFYLDIEKEKQKAYLAFPYLEWIETSGEKYGDEFVELRYPNELNSKFPLIVTFFRHHGIYIDFGESNTICEQNKSLDEAITKMIENILNDKVIICAGYKSEEMFEERRHRSFSCWYDTDDENRDMDEFYDNLENITRPLSLFDKINPFILRIFEITDWSGKRYSKVTRK